MTRTFLTTFVLALALAGCQRTDPAMEVSAAPSEWVRTPELQTAERRGHQVIVTGQASPGARVLLSAPGRQTMAVGAGADGGFSISVPVALEDVLYEIGDQQGQDVVAAPGRLLIGQAQDAPVAILMPGGSARRLDRRLVVEAVDGDGAGLLLSGWIEPSAQVAIHWQTGSATSQAGADGRWTLTVPRETGGSTFETRGRRVAVPDLSGLQPGVLQRAGAGWALRWSIAPDRYQTTWLPDGG